MLRMSLATVVRRLPGLCLASGLMTLALVTAGTLAKAASIADAPQADPTQTIVWATGDHDDTGLPAGFLLSDNEGYWGRSIYTGVTYSYESDANNPTDRIKGQQGTFGRRLLDGRIQGNWHVPVGQSRGPLVVVFDFNRPCQFREVTIMSPRSPKLAVKIETRDTPDQPWQMSTDHALEDAPQGALRRVRLDMPAGGRYLRLSLQSTGITYIDEVLVWGDADHSDTHPEHLAPTYTLEKLQNQWESIPGMQATRFDQAAHDAWRRTLAGQGGLPVILATTDASSPTKPVLPTPQQRQAGLSVQLARNETETAYVTLTNPSLTDPRTVMVQPVTWQRDGSQADIQGLSAQVRVGGALPAVPPKVRLSDEQKLRLHLPEGRQDLPELPEEIRVLPYFSTDDLPGANLLTRYLTNGSQIHRFPELTLPPGGSAMLMVRITSDGAQPGLYEGELAVTTGDGQRATLALRAQVANVTLPDADLWVRSWGPGTRQFPFETQSRRQRDVQAVRDLGVTVWGGFPEPGSKAELFGQTGHTTYRLQAVPGKYVHQHTRPSLEKLHEPEHVQAVQDHVRELVRQAKDLGLDYDQWWVELWDEPQERNVQAFGLLARLIRQTDPQVRIYMNPLFWRPGHAPPQKVFDDLSPYYNELIDVSVPISTLVRGPDAPSTALWTHPRAVNAMFIHPPGRAGRTFAWRAFSLGFNGWGYYCYFAPRGNPWDIRTWRELNYGYQMAFPGPDGPIPMPIYEIMRDGWEDYRLLAALRDHGHNALLARLIKDYQAKQPISQLRKRALDAFK